MSSSLVNQERGETILAMYEPTVDSEGLPHSINDHSAEEIYDDNYIWYKHGQIHRDNDLPAMVNKEDKHYQVWAQNDYVHRDDGKPALLSRESWKWYNRGLLHRLEGPANIRWDHREIPKHRNVETSPIRYSVWGLYGVAIPLETYQKVIAYATEQGCPVWISWFHFCEIFKDEDIEVLKNASSEWKTLLPTSWVFNLYNITDRKIRKVYVELQFDLVLERYNMRRSREIGVDKIILEIINYENKQFSKNLAMLKDILLTNNQQLGDNKSG